MKLQAIDNKYILELSQDELNSLDNILANAYTFTRDATDTQRLLELGDLILEAKKHTNNQ